MTELSTIFILKLDYFQARFSLNVTFGFKLKLNTFPDRNTRFFIIAA